MRDHEIRIVQLQIDGTDASITPLAAQHKIKMNRSEVHRRCHPQPSGPQRGQPAEDLHAAVMAIIMLAAVKYASPICGRPTANMWLPEAKARNAFATATEPLRVSENGAPAVGLG